jgi:hypothetical protein
LQIRFHAPPTIHLRPLRVLRLRRLILRIEHAIFRIGSRYPARRKYCHNMGWSRALEKYWSNICHPTVSPYRRSRRVSGTGRSPWRVVRRAQVEHLALGRGSASGSLAGALRAVGPSSAALCGRPRTRRLDHVGERSAMHAGGWSSKHASRVLMTQSVQTG